MDKSGSQDESDKVEGSVRARIIAAAASLISRDGPEAATTRAVAAIAMVQAPTIYRLFGDKKGLLDAVAEHGLELYMAQKAERSEEVDPIEDLRRSWDLHVSFGLANPHIFALMTRSTGDLPAAAAVEQGLNILRRRIRRIALTGQLRVSEEMALQLIHSVGTGTVLTLLGRPVLQQDFELSAIARESVIAAITVGQEIVDPVHVAAAVTLNAALSNIDVLSVNERNLMKEWLSRIVTNLRKICPAS